MNTTKHSTRRDNHPYQGWNVRLLLGCFVLMVLVVGCSTVDQKEPEAQGRPLSYWLKQLDDSKKFNWFTGTYDISQEPAQAIGNIGEPAVPFLIRRMREGAVAANEYDRTAHSLSDDEQKKLLKQSVPALEAQLGFEALGESGSNAVPALTRMIWSQPDSYEPYLYESLAGIGVPALPSFERALTSANGSVRQQAALASGSLGSNGAAVAPLLISLVTNAHSGRSERLSATRSLGRIGMPGEMVLPVLTGLLSSTNEELRGNACLGLMFMGQRAQTSISAIEDRLKTEAGDPDKMMIAAYMVVCGDDERVTSILERNFRIGGQSARGFTEIIAVVRQSWVKADRDAREAMMRALKPIESLEARK